MYGSEESRQKKDRKDSAEEIRGISSEGLEEAMRQETIYLQF